MSAWGDKIKGKRLDIKIRWLLVFSIVVCTTAIVLETSVSLSRTITNLTESFDADSVQSKAGNLDDTLGTYVAALKTLEINQSVQNYLKPHHGEYSQNASAVFNAMFGTAASADNIWGITLIREADGMYINSSEKPSSSNQYFLQDLQENYAASISLQKGSITYNTQHDTSTGVTTLNLYRPVYDTYRIGSRIGLLVLRIDMETLQASYGNNENTSVRTLLTGTEGNVLFSSAVETNSWENDVFPYSNQYQNQRGTFKVGDEVYVFCKVGDQKLYLVDEIPITKYTNMVMAPIAMIIGIAALILVITILAANHIIKGVYKPLQDLRRGFHQVGTGDLSVQVPTEGCGEDLEDLISGFNRMTRRIQKQMDDLVEKEKEIHRSEMDALQESIKPHFLYNTLECIHWQNVAEGNQKAARMVSALARYYRVSLAEGAETVPLTAEEEMVENYVIIQNMRFNDTITLQVDDPDGLGTKILLPRITLQPLVENAIYHGIHANDESKGWIHIFTKKMVPGKSISIVVEDSGRDMTSDKIQLINKGLESDNPSLGYGIRNVHKRLQLTYGPEYGLHYEKTDQGGTRVEIHVPFASAQSSVSAADLLPGKNGRYVQSPDCR